MPKRSSRSRGARPARDRSVPSPRRERLTFESRGALHRTAARLMDDPAVETCSIDVPNLLVEVGLASHAVARQQAVADWRRRYGLGR